MLARRWRALAASACLTVVAIGLAPTSASAAGAPNPPSITGPTGIGPNNRVASTSANISVTKAAPADIVECYTDRVEVTCPGSWTITNLEQGPHTVTAVSRDTSFNYSEAVYVYWVVDTVGPAGTVIPPSGLSNNATVSFNEDSGGITGASVKLVSDAGAAVATTRSCVTKTLELTSCGNSNVRTVYLAPESGWVMGGRYRVLVNPGGAATVVDDLGNVAASRDTTFRVQTWTEENGPEFTWRHVSKDKAAGGSFLVEARPGASATWTFSGGRLTWITVTGRSYGKAEVYVDGNLRGSFNNYSKRTRFGVERTLTGLGTGQHTVEVRALGKKGSKAGTGKLVAVDAFITRSGTEASPRVAQSWQRAADGSASNGYYSVAELAGQTAEMEFRGTSVTLHTATGPRFGKVELWVDGEPLKAANLYSSSVSFGEQITVSGLTDSRHTLQVRVLGERDSASAGTGVVVDRISVG
ncbi:MAG: hypothetical protein ABI720_11385 [Actinomycetes bacterium]